MRVKLTAGNRLTLPRAALDAVDPADYFDVSAENGHIVLTPVRVNRAGAVRAKVDGLRLSEADTADAVAWARSGASLGR